MKTGLKEGAMKMTRPEAISELSEMKTDAWTDERQMKALTMAINAIENIGHLKDRPCDVCEFHNENGCCKWTCVFTDRLFGDMR